jgi:hypothetical protein
MLMYHDIDVRRILSATYVSTQVFGEDRCSRTDRTADLSARLPVLRCVLDHFLARYIGI